MTKSPLSDATELEPLNTGGGVDQQRGKLSLVWKCDLHFFDSMTDLNLQAEYFAKSCYIVTRIMCFFIKKKKKNAKPNIRYFYPHHVLFQGNSLFVLFFVAPAMSAEFSSLHSNVFTAVVISNLCQRVRMR